MVVRLFALMVLGVWVELFEITVVVEIFSPALPDTSGECYQFLPFVVFHKKDIERTLLHERPKQCGTFELGVLLVEVQEVTGYVVGTHRGVVE